MNPFDQFDTPSGSSNPFDQFDGGQTPQRPADIPARGTPEFEARRQQLLGQQSAALSDANRAQNSIDVNKAILGPANFLNRAANAGTLGATNRIAGLFAGQDNVKRQSETARQLFPKSSIAADVGGAIGGIGKVASAGKLPSQLVGLSKRKGLAGTTAANALDGAVIAGAESLIRGGDAGQDAVGGGLLGAGLNVLTRGAGSGLSKAFKGKKPEVPTTQDLLKGASTKRKEIDDLGVSFLSLIHI